ncbi:hypothetical protein [Streptomyces pacificus]|uniref:Uncharacterized protein n=1 Tax=Streptomyces pacificus TaxID=2705029 RepID=A0A6A0ASW4_9ACTN|nr:hypothetical protein [Streptomyces pacificus]GFH35451.1 hypothetical protein SCWH03_16670 [Streptomyces pacificus]
MGDETLTVDQIRELRRQDGVMGRGYVRQKARPEGHEMTDEEFRAIRDGKKSQPTSDTTEEQQ